jgi:hypothetical protein
MPAETGGVRRSEQDGRVRLGRRRDVERWCEREPRVFVAEWVTTIEQLRARVRQICSNYESRKDRTRRLFIEERAASLHHNREQEYIIKRDIAKYFGISYASVCFCGSGQLGFSIIKEKLFEPAVSDLDAACIDSDLFQKAWIDIIETTRAFTDFTAFGKRPQGEIDRLKDQLLRRGMIRVDAMPTSRLQRQWSQFQGDLSRRHTELFSSITLAIYMNEHAFCWKQDSALSRLMRG